MLIILNLQKLWIYSVNSISELSDWNFFISSKNLTILWLCLAWYTWFLPNESNFWSATHENRRNRIFKFNNSKLWVGDIFFEFWKIQIEIGIRLVFQYKVLNSVPKELPEKVLFSCNWQSETVCSCCFVFPALIRSRPTNFSQNCPLGRLYIAIFIFGSFWAILAKKWILDYRGPRWHFLVQFCGQ